jgi:hypothetical protein
VRGRRRLGYEHPPFFRTCAEISSFVWGPQTLDGIVSVSYVWNRAAEWTRVAREAVCRRT